MSRQDGNVRSTAERMAPATSPIQHHPELMEIAAKRRRALKMNPKELREYIGQEDERLKKLEMQMIFQAVLLEKETERDYARMQPHVRNVNQSQIQVVWEKSWEVPFAETQWTKVEKRIRKHPAFIRYITSSIDKQLSSWLLKGICEGFKTHGEVDVGPFLGIMGWREETRAERLSFKREGAFEEMESNVVREQPPKFNSDEQLDNMFDRAVKMHRNGTVREIGESEMAQEEWNRRSRTKTSHTKEEKEQHVKRFFGFKPCYAKNLIRSPIAYSFGIMNADKVRFIIHAMYNNLFTRSTVRMHIDAIPTVNAIIEQITRTDASVRSKERTNTTRKTLTRMVQGHTEQRAKFKAEHGEAAWKKFADQVADEIIDTLRREAEEAKAEEKEIGPRFPKSTREDRGTRYFKAKAAGDSEATALAKDQGGLEFEVSPAIGTDDFSNWFYQFGVRSPEENLIAAWETQIPEEIWNSKDENGENKYDRENSPPTTENFHRNSEGKRPGWYKIFECLVLNQGNIHSIFAGQGASCVIGLAARTILAILVIIYVDDSIIIDFIILLARASKTYGTMVTLAGFATKPQKHNSLAEILTDWGLSEARTMYVRILGFDYIKQLGNPELTLKPHKNFWVKMRKIIGKMRTLEEEVTSAGAAQDGGKNSKSRKAQERNKHKEALDKYRTLVDSFCGLSVSAASTAWLKHPARQLTRKLYAARKDGATLELEQIQGLSKEADELLDILQKFPPRTFNFTKTRGMTMSTWYDAALESDIDRGMPCIGGMLVTEQATLAWSLVLDEKMLRGCAATQGLHRRWRIDVLEATAKLINQDTFAEVTLGRQSVAFGDNVTQVSTYTAGFSKCDTLLNLAEEVSLCKVEHKLDDALHWLPSEVNKADHCTRGKVFHYMCCSTGRRQKGRRNLGPLPEEAVWVQPRLEGGLSTMCMKGCRRIATARRRERIMKQAGNMSREGLMEAGRRKLESVINGKVQRFSNGYGDEKTPTLRRIKEM